MGNEFEILNIAALGDRALVVQFESRISPAINDQVIGLTQAIEPQVGRGVEFLIPAYCSLTVGFDPQRISRADLESRIRQLASRPAEPKSPSTTEIVEVPVCYDRSLAIDQIEIQRQTGLAWSDVVARHQSRLYRVYMLGFLPGFGYLGDLDPALHCRRHATPRATVEAGSVAIAGLQTGIYPSRAPGGWQIVGRTPMSMRNDTGNGGAVLQPGQRVRFRQISLQEFQNWQGHR